jgi:hypothetical protein
MSPLSKRGIRRALFVVTLAGALAGCYAEVYDADYPPATYVSTAEPVYYEGRPVYWYHDHWYYRDARGWRHYGNEPASLHEHRVATARRQPGWHARPAEPPPPPPPAGGWRR